MKNYFAVLQIPENSSHDDIQKAYRRLAKLYHPDVSTATDAHEKFCEITEAYEFLMNHWPQRAIRYPGETVTQQTFEEYLKTDAYEKFRQEVREQAYRQARMRYEKFKKQHEAFQQSGINDIALLLTILIRAASIVLFLFLFLLPIVLAIMNEWMMIFLAFFVWPFAGIIGWYIMDNRRHYLMPGHFYYNLARIKHLFTEKHAAQESCFYCPYKSADSRPYLLELLKLKDIRYKSGGFRQHHVNYINRYVTIAIPRSHKAFILHTTNAALKIISIVSCLLFLDISSIVWRFVIGIILGGATGALVLLITRTRSNKTYLFSLGMIARIAIWILCLVLVSQFTIHPFNITTNDSIYFVITSIIVFDSFLMQLINFMLGKKSSQPLIMQHPAVTEKFKEGFIVCNDIPVLSVVYPMFRWLLG